MSFRELIGAPWDMLTPVLNAAAASRGWGQINVYEQFETGNIVFHYLRQDIKIVVDPRDVPNPGVLPVIMRSVRVREQIDKVGWELYKLYEAELAKARACQGGSYV